MSMNCPSSHTDLVGVISDGTEEGEGAVHMVAAGAVMVAGAMAAAVATMAGVEVAGAVMAVAAGASTGEGVPGIRGRPAP
jgi:hypothetical protein